MNSLWIVEWWQQVYARHRGGLFVVQALAFVLVGITMASLLWRETDRPLATTSEMLAVADSEAPTIWTCSMHPQIRQPKSGQCPICGMDLIPVAQTSAGLRTLALSQESTSLMRIETTPVERRFVTHQIPLVGRVDYDETRLGYITAWVPGRLDRLYVDFTGVEVKQGDHLVYIYSEQLYTIQEELIQSLRNRRERPSNSTGIVRTIDLVESAREKLRLLGLKEEQIAEIEQRDRPSDHMTIYAPLGGIVIEKLKQQGERVQLGERIYTIADLSQVWVHLDVYESDLPWVRYGQDVTITTEAYPGEEFHGRIAFIQPVLNDKTRTIKMRVNVPNPSRKLKPEMFVHARVWSKIAAGGKVADPSLAGKWISPMHPEIIKDEPGTCDICGMPLVQAESLGYVTASTEEDGPPLVIPYSAALVTGTRAIVYVQLPLMPSAVEPAVRALSTSLEQGGVDSMQSAFAQFAAALDQPYDQPGTEYAKQLWNEYADRLARYALAGQRAGTIEEGKRIFAKLEMTMNAIREQFAPLDRPTFEGREIVLGSRAGDYYLVQHGLQAGELVVVEGNFKIDAEIQIQAKPSMMTPEGGGAVGHDHGGEGQTIARDSASEELGSTTAALPADFVKQIRSLQTVYDLVSEAIGRQDAGQATAAFVRFGEALEKVDASLLTGHPRMVWKEFAMLLGNDASEGRAARQLDEADRVFLLLKGHMRRMREQLGIPPAREAPIEPLVVPPAFQQDLAQVWERYLAVSRALAADSLSNAQQHLVSLESAIATVDDQLLDDRARNVWSETRDGLQELLPRLAASKDLKAMRTEFLPLSEEIGKLAKVFGFGEPGPVYELHCPMAFEGKGAIWYQDNDQTRNPYFGATMLTCADRVERLVRDEPAIPWSGDQESHPQHSHH